MDIQPEGTPTLFERLKAVLTRYEVFFKVKQDTPEAYILDTLPTSHFPEETTFGGVEAADNGVIYHLTPVERFETVSNVISPQLKEHMQGSSSFYFTSREEENLFQEIEALTQLSVDKMRMEGLL
jgi:hypothetical protein